MTLRKQLAFRRQQRVKHLVQQYTLLSQDTSSSLHQAEALLRQGSRCMGLAEKIIQKSMNSLRHCILKAKEINRLVTDINLLLKTVSKTITQECENVRRISLLVYRDPTIFSILDLQNSLLSLKGLTLGLNQMYNIKLFTCFTIKKIAEYLRIALVSILSSLLYSEQCTLLVNMCATHLDMLVLLRKQIVPLQRRVLNLLRIADSLKLFKHIARNGRL